MITIEEITKLAGLARIKLTEKEKQELQHDMEAILDYFKKLANLDIYDGKDNFLNSNYNKFRDDKNTNKKEEYSEILLTQAPDKEKGYLRVKRILN